MKDTLTYSEEELVALLKQRVQSAFSYLYDHYSASLNGIIINIVEDVNMSTDILQEVFLKIWQQIDHYDPQKGRLFTWMFQIARNAAIDMIRSKGWRNHKRNSGLTDEVVGIPDQPFSLLENRGLRKLVYTLKQEYRMVVELSYFQGYTQEEIAKLLDLPLGTVKTRLRSALIQLRKQVNI